MYGDRGCLHDASGEIVRFAATRRWIAYDAANASRLAHIASSDGFGADAWDRALQ